MRRQDGRAAPRLEAAAPVGRRRHVLPERPLAHQVAAVGAPVLLLGVEDGLGVHVEGVQGVEVLLTDAEEVVPGTS